MKTFTKTVRQVVLAPEKKQLFQVSPWMKIMVFSFCMVFTFSLYGQLSGTYSVGSGKDYPSITLALNALYTVGANGNVVFEVASGYTYNGEVGFYAYTGNGSYSVTIRPASGATGIIFSNTTGARIFRFNASSANFIIDGADPSTGDKVFTFQSTEGTTSTAVQLESGSNRTIKNCIFNVTAYGINTSSTTSLMSNHEISDCEFINVNTSSSATIYAINTAWSNNSNFVVKNSIFKSDPSAPDMANYLAIYASGSLSAINNSISARSDYFSGIRISGSTHQSDIYNNTISLYGSEVGTGTPQEVFGIYAQKTSSAVLNVKNNIIDMRRSYDANYTKYGMFFYSGNSNQSMDYNNISVYDDGNSDWYYVKNGSFGFYDELSEIQTYMPNITLSNPTFNNTTSGVLSLAGESLSNSDFRGTPTTVTTDILGNARNAESPSKGAYESINNIADIVGFTVPGMVSATIDNVANTVEFIVPTGASLTLTPTIGLFAQAQSVSPASGVQQNFSSPVNYTVTAFDGTQKSWTVSAKVPSSAANILSFSLPAQTGPASIDAVNHTVDIEVATTTADMMVPTYTISADASVTAGPVTGVSFNFSQPRVITVLAEDGETSIDWTVTVIWQPYPGGTYQVGAGGDFTTLITAMSGITKAGISGDVILEIGNDHTTAAMNAFSTTWKSVNAGHSIVIRPASDVSNLTLNFGGGSFTINEFENFTFDGQNKISIVSTSTSALFGIYGISGHKTNNVTIKNLTLTSQSGFFRLQNSSNTYIENCKMYFTGTAGSQRRAISIESGDEAVFVRNNYMEYGSGYTATDLSLIYAALYTNLSIYNNVFNIATTNVNTLDGIRLNIGTSGTIKILNNTMLIGGAASGINETVTAIGFNSSVTLGAVVKNNIIQITRNPGTSGILTGVSYFSSLSSIDLGYNNVYLSNNGSNTRNIYTLGGTPVNDAGILGTSTDQAAFANVENDDLHLSGSSLSNVSLRGTPVAEVSTDKEGTSRSTNSPSRGAYEHPNILTGVISFDVPQQSGDEVITDNFSVTVAINVAAGTNRSSLTPTIVVQPGATISPASGVAQNFTNPVVYTVTAEAGNTKVWTVTVTELNAAPTNISLTNSSIAENGAVNAVIGTLSSTDANAGQTHSYSLVSGTGDTDNASFNINGTQLRASASFDFETKSSYSILVQTNDQNGGTFQKQLSITITNANDAPTDVNLSNTTVAENMATGTTVGTLTSVDQDASDSHTYSLKVTTPDNAFFSISGDQLLTNAVFDYESKSTYNLEIITNDGHGGTFEQEIAVTVTDVGPTVTDITLSSSSFNENLPASTTVGTFTAVGTEFTTNYTFSLVSGEGDTQNSSFFIADGALKTAGVFDFETSPIPSIRVRANNGAGSTFDKVFTINLLDANDAPSDMSLSASSIEESQPGGTVIGTFTTTDQDAGETYSYSLVAGSGDTDNASFSITGSTLKSAAVFDFETKSSLSIRVQTNDGNGGTFQKMFSVQVNDIAAQVTSITLSNASISENQAVNTSIGSFSTFGEDLSGTFTYSLVAGTGDTDNGSFTISGGTLLSNAVFNFESKSSYSIRVNSNDGIGNSDSKVISVTINDANDAPTNIALSGTSVAENLASGADVGTLSTTDEDTGDTFTYSLVSGSGDTDNSLFSVSGNKLLSAAIFDYEVKNSYSVRVKTSDGNGATFEKAFTIGVADVLESAAKNILTFSLSEQTGDPVINSTDHTVAITVPFGTAVTSLSPTLTVSDNASATPSSGASQDFTSAVVYKVTAQDGSMLDWTVTVTIAPNTANDIITFTLAEQTGDAVINSENHTVAVGVPYGTNLTALTPTITVSEQATMNPTSGAAANFSSAVVYTVTAGSGTTQEWTVTVTPATNSATDIVTFSFAEQTAAATIDAANHTVNIQVATGTSLTALMPTITVSDQATVSPASGVAQDFSAPVAYTVTAGNGSTQAWTITVTVAPAPLSNAKDILTFSLAEQTAAATIDATGRTIAIEVATGTNVTSLVPTITVSVAASISPASGAAQDFTSAVVYTVTAEDASTQAWTVTVTVAPAPAPLSSAKDILTFELAEQTGAATIDGVAQTVQIEVANGTNVASLSPTITVSVGASIDPASGVAQDFTNAVVYTVTAEDGTTQAWTATVTVQEETTTTGVAEMLASISVYPNPTVDYMQVNGLTRGANVQLIGLDGMLLTQPTEATTETVLVEMKQLQSGVYILRVSTEGAAKSFRIIKN